MQQAELEKKNSLDDDQVAEFLRLDPEFFQRNPQLLELLDVPHNGPEGTVSLIERQVAVLRHRERATSAELGQLVEIARRNEQIADRLHMLAIRFMECANMDEFLDELIYGLRNSFGISSVKILIPDPEHAGERPELVPPDHALLTELRDVLLNGQPAVCFNDLMEFDLEPVFGENHDMIRSFTILPVGGSWGGVLVLGSTDAQEYCPDAGTRFLEKLSKYAGATAERCLRKTG
ncbi:MAG: hypothetical protein DSZ32_05280 [Gammaproteobacteria bacterium]|nr:MAG: hypothetical protein DSZ32_05280 [Gammaproteobacteria bacterium]